MIKRFGIFLLTNIIILVTLSTVLSLLGVKPYIEAQGINYESLALFCLVWGMGASFISLLLSRKMAKWMSGVKLVDENSQNPDIAFLVQKVTELSKSAGLPKVPEIGIYESPDLNAFATGPSKSRSLVAVSTGLLQRSNRTELEGVLAHEVAHIANGDMITMTLIQGVVNAFVMFFARVAAWFAMQLLDEEKGPIAHFVVVIVCEILFGILAMLVVAHFSRKREYRADEGGARLAGREPMISALKLLQRTYDPDARQEGEPALATLKISGKNSSGSFKKLWSTHPDLQLRIERLEMTI